MWIHQNQNWPNFNLDHEALAFKLGDLRHRQGNLLGRMEGLGFDLRQEANLSILTSDIVKSSAIEGEHLDTAEVRSSVAQRLGIDIASLPKASRHVDGIVAMMLDATQQFSKPLTQNRLFNWQASLFPNGHSGMHRITVGNWRTDHAGPMQVISGPFGKEKVHFEAPAAQLLKAEMHSFLQWFEQPLKLDPVLKAGIAHFWFVTIHPFEDGNGRIARAVCDMALARADNQTMRFYSMSSQIEAEREHYYDQLEHQQRGSLDITQWMIWFLECLGRAISSAETMLSTVLDKARIWEFVNTQPVNGRQRSIINRMLEADFKGHMNTSKYAKLAKCSTDTALRDIQELKARGIFIQNPGGGRSTSYRCYIPS